MKILFRAFVKNTVLATNPGLSRQEAADALMAQMSEAVGALRPLPTLDDTLRDMSLGIIRPIGETVDGWPTRPNPVFSVAPGRYRPFQTIIAEELRALQRMKDQVSSYDFSQLGEACEAALRPHGMASDQIEHVVAIDRSRPVEMTVGVLRVEGTSKPHICQFCKTEVKGGHCKCV